MSNLSTIALPADEKDALTRKYREVLNQLGAATRTLIEIRDAMPQCWDRDFMDQQLELLLVVIPWASKSFENLSKGRPADQHPTRREVIGEVMRSARKR